MADKKIILKNFNEYFEMAEYAHSRIKYNASVTLYYKALVELCDLELLNKLNKIGANHTERFKLLEISTPELYSIASKMFRFYRDSYSKEITETIAKLVKENVETAKKIVLE